MKILKESFLDKNLNKSIEDLINYSTTQEQDEIDQAKYCAKAIRETIKNCLKNMEIFVDETYLSSEFKSQFSKEKMF